MIDTNAWLSRWPFRRLPHDEPGALVAKLRGSGFTRVLAGNFDSLLHKDLGAVNGRTAALCKAHGDGLLVPIGTVNPALPDWEEELRRCAEEHAMPGIRLHPNYHGYALGDPRFARLLSLAAKRNILVQIALSMEDERTQRPGMHFPPVDPGPLRDLVRQTPGLKLVLHNQNWANDWPQARELSEAGQVYFDFSMLEGLGAVSRMLRELPADRVLLGSHFPFFYLEAAMFKVREAGLSAEEERNVTEANARRLLRASRGT